MLMQFIPRKEDLSAMTVLMTDYRDVSDISRVFAGGTVRDGEKSFYFVLRTRLVVVIILVGKIVLRLLIRFLRG